MIANGLAHRRLRSRSSGDGGLVGGVAGQVVAAEPLDRDDPAGEQVGGGGGDRVVRRPAPRRARRGRSGWGPQSGQATGSAWNRRSAGSAYSAAQAWHIANSTIVVAARS